MLTDSASVPAGTRLRTVLHHGSLESTVDLVVPEPPADGERMYDVGIDAVDQ